MPSTALSEVRIKTLKPRESVYDIRDAKLRGFGVRVLPSGAKRFFIHSQYRGERLWKILGDANAMCLEKARARAISTLAVVRRGENTSGKLERLRSIGPIFAVSSFPGSRVERLPTSIGRMFSAGSPHFGRRRSPRTAPRRCSRSS